MRFFVFVALGLGLISLNACSNPNDVAYAQLIMQHRAATTYKFLDPATTPLTQAKLANFKGLPYYEVNKIYLVEATFNPTGNQTIFAMPHTLNRVYEYVEAGTLSFTLNGKNLQLMSYLRKGEMTDSVQLFIPFTDLTGGKSTYGGGRYLDVKAKLSAKKVWIDFNFAYNPYCAYNVDFSCPIPPNQNHLPVAIEAGEQYKTVY
jgi:uncharacterized protein (DUF1684 family)